MPAVSASVTPVAGPSQRQQGQGTSSDESPTEDHVLLQRPAAQPGDRPRVNHRRAVSASHAAHLSDGGLAYPALSYNGSRHKRHDRPDRPSSAALVGVGPGPYPGLSRRSTLDYVVPTMDPEKRGSMVLSDTSARERTVGERLGPTLKHALKERTIAERKAKISGYALNVCIGLQVVLGAITTGVAAASTTSRTSTSVGIPILGGLSTLAASYLARARGSGEPENSIVRAHDLDHFIRDTEAFLLDFGHLTGTQYDRDVQQYRMRFEEIMGHSVGMNNTQTKEQLHMGGPANGWTSASADGRPPVSPMSAGQMGHAGQMSPMAQVNQIPPGHMGQAGHTGPVGYAGQMPGGQPAPMGYPGYIPAGGQMLPMPVTMPTVGH